MLYVDPTLHLATATNSLDLQAPTHALYLTLSLGATIWVARTLHKHGRLFLVDAMKGNTALADGVNQLLAVGFYLLNIGYVLNQMNDARIPESLGEMMAVLGSRLGNILMVLGAMHFFNLFLFNRLRVRGALHRAPPPVGPSQVIAPPRMASVAT